MNCVYCNNAPQHHAYAPLCITCHHWLEAVTRQSQLVIADGHAYQVGSDTDSPRGFGGVRWRIEWSDGRKANTCSLWHLGRIPARFAPLLPTNATLEQVQRYTTEEILF